MAQAHIAILWKDPPPVRAGTGKLDPRWEELRKHPKMWCLWREGSRNAASSVVKSHPGFKAVSRNSRRDENNRRVSDIYVRYVGDGANP